MKIVSLNIEGDKHTERVMEFLIKQQPDVVCLSEVFEDYANYLALQLGMSCVFAHQCYRPSLAKKDLTVKTFGVALLSINIIANHIHYIVGDEHKIPCFHRSFNLNQKPHNIFIPAIIATIFHNGLKYNITTTHLSVTPDGKTTEYQINHEKDLVRYLNKFSDMIICGDFNAPRGGEAFSYFAKIYKDNIPKKYTTSLDQNLHRVKGLQRMVDCLFSTEKYKFNEVSLIDGISDHMAVVGNVEIL